MDYEKKYKDLVKAVKVLQETNPSDECIQNWVNENVLELAESEDERIKSAILGFLEGSGQEIIVPGIRTKEAINWLEKQGNDSYLQEKIENFTNAHKGEDPEGIIAACRGGEEQGEHKPANEPKFKVGDTIRLKNSLAEFTIESISNGRYYFRGSSIDIIACDRDYYLAVPNLANSAKTCKDEQKLSNLESIGKEWSKEDEKEWKSIVSVLTRMHFLDELDWLRSKLNK